MGVVPSTARTREHLQMLKNWDTGIVGDTLINIFFLYIYVYDHIICTQKVKDKYR